MYPHERSLVKKYDNRPFSIVGINSDIDREQLIAVMEKESITWRSFFQGSTGGAISSRWNVNAWPTIYILDAEGRIRFKNVRGDDLDEALEALVTEAEESSASSKPEKEETPEKERVEG